MIDGCRLYSKYCPIDKLCFAFEPPPLMAFLPSRRIGIVSCRLLILYCFPFHFLTWFEISVVLSR